MSRDDEPKTDPDPEAAQPVMKPIRLRVEGIGPETAVQPGKMAPKRGTAPANTIKRRPKWLKKKKSP